MNELLFIKNIKDLLFPQMEQNNFEKHLNNLLLIFNKNNTHLWYDIKYLNTCLELFFIYYSKIKDPLSIFYSFFFKNLSTKNVIKNLNIDKKTKNKINYYISCDDYLVNDLLIKETDFDIFKSILIYSNFIEIPLQSFSKLFGGLSSEADKGLSFKFKGNIDKSKLTEYISLILEQMTYNYDLILNQEIKQIYLDKINFIVSEYKTFKVR